MLATCVILQVFLTGCLPDDLTDKLTGSNSSADSNASTQNTIPTTASIQSLGFEFVSDEVWDDTAVRKVLHTFAYGGNATDDQINTWAEMRSDQAIVEMLTFDEHNSKLSPVTASNYDGLDQRDGTLRGLSEFWSSDDPQNGTYEDDRWKYDLTTDISKIWTRAATSHGLNPFRQKIGLWETNYHLAVNIESTVFPEQIIRYYDDIMEELESGSAYDEVLTLAATSSAVALQYGHHRNRFRDGFCYCNEDFAREYYQLFFGILGDYDPDYHETVTIKNTARALTDMTLVSNVAGRPDSISFGTEFHYPGILEMLGNQYWGVDTPDRINQLSQNTINHPESLANLPVKIIAGLADDNLDENKIIQIRNAWNSMQEKNLLDFLRAYAISTLFHSESRIKYLSSIDRHMLMANKVILTNEEMYRNFGNVEGYEDEDVIVFHPTHNVFGSQTGIEASLSSNVFRENYRRSTQGGYLNYNSSGVTHGRSWEKDWGNVVPESESGGYVVKDVAEWLWNRFVADGLKNFGSLERAHVYALLASNRDLIYLVYPENLDMVITSSQLESDSALISLVENLSNNNLALSSLDTDERLFANERVGQAINFIEATPFIFAQEGR